MGTYNDYKRLYRIAENKLEFIRSYNSIEIKASKNVQLVTRDIRQKLIGRIKSGKDICYEQ